MPRWLSIALAVGCWLGALQQVRMYFIYAGRIYSPTIGAIEGGPTLRAIAIRSATTLFVYGLIVLLIPWPRLLTYISTIWLCRAIVDGVFAINGAMHMRILGRRYLTIEAFRVFYHAIIVAVCAYFFGF